MQPLIDIIKQVLTSWQVIAITIVILLYVSIVNYVSRTYHKPRAAKNNKTKVKKKKEAPAALPAGEPEDNITNDSNDELGLEEA
ncbi:MAG: hypothetical protein FWC22_06080 [Treponema sp.]|nr:hypothetical protein [Treponema sp.]